MNPSDILQGSRGITLQGSSPALQAQPTNLQGSGVQVQGPSPVSQQALSVQPLPQMPTIGGVQSPSYSPLRVEPLSADWLGADQAYNPFARQDDVNYFISDGTQINPLTGEAYAAGDVVFEGPDWLVNNPIFENALKPILDRPVQYGDDGKPIHDILTNEFKTTIDSIRQTAIAMVDVKREFTGATDEDALTYLRNIAAADASDKDENTQIVWSVTPDGAQRTASVKELVDTIRGYSDSQKAAMYDNYTRQLQDPNTTPAQKAVLASILQFAMAKNLLGPSAGTQARVGATAALAQSDSGLIGAISDRYASFFGNLGEGLATGEFDWTTNAERARQALENDPLARLPGVENARAIGNITGMGTAIIADIVGANAIGGGLGTVASRAALGTGKTAKSAQALSSSLTKLANSGNTGRVIARTISTLPEEAVFAGLQTAANAGDYETAKEFGIGAASNLALFTGGRTFGRVLSAIDPDASAKLTRVNDDISRAIIGGWDKFTSLPGLNKALNKTVSGLIDSDRTARKAARKLFSEGKTTKDEYRRMLNNIADHRNKGRQLTKEVLEFENAEVYDAALGARLNIESLGDDVAQQADEYVWSVLQKQYHDAGKIKLNESQLEAVEASIAKGADNAEWNAYRDAIVNLETGVVDSFSKRGILDADAIDSMRADEAFSNGYIHMKRLIEPDWQPRFDSKKFKDRAAVRRIRGGTQELASPVQAVIEHANALAEISSQNQVVDIFRQLMDAGLAQGRWLQTPEQVRQFKKLSTELAKEREAVQAIMEETGSQLAIDLTKLVDDAEDIYGVANQGIGAYVDDALEDLLQAIQTEKRFAPAIQKLVSELPDGVANPQRTAALEIFGAYRNDLMKSFQKQFDTTRLDREASELIERMIRSRVDDQTQLARAEAGGSAVGDVQRVEPVSTPLGERNKELKDLRADLGDVDGNPNAIPYYRDGARGYFEIDDPVIRDYFNSTTRNAVDDGLIARTFTNSARIFRAMTTGLNPVFALMVNPTRDVVRATVTGGVDFMSPRSTMKMILDANPQLGREGAEQLLRRIENSVELDTRVGSSRLPNALQEDALARYRNRQASGAKEHLVALKDNIKVDKSALKRVENITMGAPENIVRKRAGAVAYAKAKARGVSEEVAISNAIFAAREATTNFAPVGRSVQSFVRTVPYLTAAINGRASFLRMWQLDPIGVTSRLAGGIVAPATMIAANNMRDDETAAAYFDIPEWERRSNLIVMLPGGDNLKIPMDQELMAIVNPFIEQFEILHGLDRSTADNIFRTILSGSPVDLTGFAERDMQGNLDIRGAAAQVAGSLTPQLLQAPLELVAGRDLYTGQPLSPTDAQLIDQGAVPGEITNADRTFASRNSRTLGFIADALGVPQGNVQNVFSNFTGGVGGMLLNAFDTIIGAPEEERGGRSIQENTARRFFGKSYSQSQQDYYAGINDLEAEKKNVQLYLQELNQRAFNNPNDQSIIEQRQAAIDKYGEKVADFAQSYGDFYQQAGGLKPFQVNALVRLLNLGPEQGAFDPNSANAAQLQQAIYAGQEDARLRAQQIGLPDTTSRDQFGQLRATDDGSTYVDYGNISRSGRILQDQFYGAPEQMAYEFEQIFKGDKRSNTPSMNDIRSQYFDAMEPLYARARQTRGREAQAIYDEINALQSEYVGVLATRLRPVLEKYGVNAVRNNKKVLDEVAKFVMVPGDYTPFASRNKQPYMTRDAEAFILDYLGVGQLSSSNIPTDETVLAAIRQANTDLDAGRTSSAAYRLNNIQNSIEEGRNYATVGDMTQIRQLIERANNVRR